MAIENWIATQLPDLTEFRRDLHQNPELLYDVHRTASRVADALRAAGVDEVHEGIGQTGVVGIIRGQSDRSGRMIGLRADMDALPIVEETGAPWASKVPGKMHGCGHDGHTTMLLGAARHLAESRTFDGTVAVIFQPAEEGGAGGKAMIDDGLFTRFPIDEVYGMHNMPGLEIGEFAIAPGPLMASVDQFRIDPEGVGARAAFRHEAPDPLMATSALLQAGQSIVSRNLDPLKAAVVSLTTVHGGDAFNVIPQSISMTGTVRTLDEDVRAMVRRRLERMVQGVADAFGARGGVEYKTLYPVTVNDPERAEHSASAAREVAGEARVHTGWPPTMGGEDFSFMLNERPGAMIFTGNGPSAGLHHPGYDCSDEAIAWGCSYWTTLVRQRLSPA